MVVPDFELICEIMLVAEGFQEARLLARKFITLYSLCRELLSKQDHYDWGLRAIKSVLVVAGSLKVKWPASCPCLVRPLPSGMAQQQPISTMGAFTWQSYLCREWPSHLKAAI